MSMDEYLTILTGQIRSPKAKAMVEREIKDHIEDQTKAYESAGLNREEAVMKAVVQMGDPVSVGVELDRIHRPRAGWSFILWIVFLSIVGLLVQYFCYYRIGPVSGNQHYYAGSESAFLRQCLFTLTGLMIMGIIYFVDYSILGKLSKILGFLFLGGLWFFCALKILPSLNGSFSYLKCLLYLFVPIYGGILYLHRGSGFSGLCKSLLWLGAAFWLGTGWIGGGLGVTLDMAAVCYAMFLFSVSKGWFSVPKKPALLFFGLLAPAAGLILSLVSLNFYQTARIQAFLNPEAYSKTSGYIPVRAREIVSGLTLWGTKWETLDKLGKLPAQILPGVPYDYMMLQTASVAGVAAAAILTAFLVFFCCYLMRMVFRQKSQLGLIIGFGSAPILSIETVRSLLNNFVCYTLSTGGLLFFSYGKSHTIAVYALLGILLSIYRHQDLVWEQKQGGKSRGDGVLFEIGKYRLRIERR